MTKFGEELIASAKEAVEIAKKTRRKPIRSRKLIEKTKPLAETLKFFKLHKDVQIPTKATEGSACFDLSYFPWTDEVTVYSKTSGKFVRPINQDDRSIVIMPGDRMLIPTGLVADIPEGYFLRAYTRSSVGLKKGLHLAQSVGIIDSDYTDELFIPFINVSEVRVKIEPGERLIQIEMVKSIPYDIKEIKKRPELKKDRKGGFGSTGEK